MRKRVGIIKQVSCLSLVFLLSINNFAAVVSDNDGAAFITKAEFDALKNDFQSQIDSYNNSIDNKIDGAIASYLAGIRLSTVIELNNLQQQYKISTSDKKLDQYWSSSTDVPLTMYNTSAQKTTAHLYTTFVSRVDAYGTAIVGVVDKTYGSYDPQSHGTIVQNQNNTNFERIITWEPKFEVLLFFNRYMQMSGDNSYSRATGWVDSTTTGQSWIRYGSDSSANNFDKKFNTAGDNTANRNAYVTFFSDGEKNYNGNFAFAPLATTAVYYVKGNQKLGYITKSEEINWSNTSDPFGGGVVWGNGAYASTTVKANTSGIPLAVYKLSYMKTNEMIWSDVKTVSDKNDSINKGLHLLTLTDNGTLQIKVKVDTAGRIYFWKSIDADLYWGGIRNSSLVIDQSKVGYDSSITANVEKIIEMPVVKNDVIWFVFLPSSTSVYGKITQLNTFLIKET